jgi:nanoRNase/pAp phosphatase (c-di-AMP/oligoRNAs hydrolase)
MPDQKTHPLDDKLREFRRAVLPASSALILTHDYPDPDCIASAWGISELLSFWGVGHPVISFGGFVGRAENRAMIRFLNIPTVPFALTDVNDFEKIILVDCYPGRGNVSLPPNARLHAVIDHHPSEPPPDAAFFHDIRSGYGAAATIVTQYLMQSDCPISPRLATALFCGIKTDTSGMRRGAAADDIECYKRLFETIDHRLLSKIENPERGVEYFRIIHKAAESAISYKDVGYIHLGTVITPDCIAEMAELFHTWEKIEWMVCTAIFKNQIYFSIRSNVSGNAGARAEQLAQRLGGNGGGHSKAAAGRAPIDKNIALTLGKIEFYIKEIFEVADAEAEPLL